MENYLIIGTIVALIFSLVSFIFYKKSINDQLNRLYKTIEALNCELRLKCAEIWQMQDEQKQFYDSHLKALEELEKKNSELNEQLISAVENLELYKVKIDELNEALNRSGKTEFEKMMDQVLDDISKDNPNNVDFGEF